MKTLILGLGNPIRGDDSVGLHVARALESRVNQEEVRVTEAYTLGLDLLELLAGYDRAIIIDAIQIQEGKAGQVYRLEPGIFTATRRLTTPHEVNFATALELGRQLGLTLPQKITIFGIEVTETESFSEECTPEVRAAIPACVGLILQELSKQNKN